jgi:dienelactone hydrolase
MHAGFCTDSEEKTGSAEKGTNLMINQDFKTVLEKFSANYPAAAEYAGSDFLSWQSEFKAKVFELKGREIKRIPLKVSFEQEEDAGTHTRRKVLIDATELSSASGYLLVPKRKQKKYPALIASPGHYQFGKDTIAGHPCSRSELKSQPGSDYGKAAVEAGYVVFVPDWWGWGDKSAHLETVGPRRDRCNVIQMAASMYGFSVLYLHMLEADAMIDYLERLNIVDAGRIGVIGNSYGGRTAMWIGAFNKKIKCVVSAGAMNFFRERASKLSCCAIQYFPGILQYGDVGEIYSLIAPRPLQLQAGSEDTLITLTDRDKIAEIVKKAYQAVAKADNLNIEFFQGGHTLNWPLAEKFLSKHL